MSGRRAPRPPKRLADYDITSVRRRSRSRSPASDVSPSGGGALVELEEQTRAFQTPAAPSQGRRKGGATAGRGRKGPGSGPSSPGGSVGAPAAPE